MEEVRVSVGYGDGGRGEAGKGKGEGRFYICVTDVTINWCVRTHKL